MQTRYGQTEKFSFLQFSLTILKFLQTSKVVLRLFFSISVPKFHKGNARIWDNLAWLATWPLPTHRCQIIAGQLSTANSLQGRCATGNWRESQSEGQESRHSAEQRQWPGASHFSHSPPMCILSCCTELWAVWSLGHSGQWQWMDGQCGRQWRLDSPHFYSSCPALPLVRSPSPLCTVPACLFPCLPGSLSLSPASHGELSPKQIDHVQLSCNDLVAVSLQWWWAGCADPAVPRCPILEMLGFELLKLLFIPVFLFT